MIYQLTKENDKERFLKRSNELLKGGHAVELKQVKRTRTQQQNRALHLFYGFISDELNEIGLQFQYHGIKGAIMELKYTPDLVKNFIWRPIQIAMFETESTTKIDTKQMNEIIDIIINFFAERGIVLSFPSIETLIENEQHNN